MGDTTRTPTRTRANKKTSREKRRVDWLDCWDEDQVSAWRAAPPPDAPHPLARDATHIFGLGAQKAGTTWLFDFLHGHGDVHTPLLKEVRYFSRPFDYRPGATQEKALDRVVNAAVDYRDKDNKPLRERRVRLMERILWNAMFPVGKDGYAGYFRYLAEGYGGQPAVCDITPAYALIEADMLRIMRALVPRARFVFLMRDPVDRAWSQARMYGHGVRGQNQKGGDRSVEVMEKLISDFRPGQPSRDNYLFTLDNMAQALPEEERMVIFYESFFKAQDTEALTTFLGLAPRAGNFTLPSNTGSSQPLPEALALKATRKFLPVYEGMVERFGDAVPEKWLRRLDAARAA